jgi:hypothetical protein
MEKLNRSDAAAGAIFVIIGAGFALGSRTLEIGSTFRMGPGYFPLLLSFLLMLVGLVIVVGSFAGRGEPLTAVPWRGLLLVLPAPVLFGLTVRKLGLLPAIVLTVLLATFASRHATLPLAVVLCLGLTAFCLAVFSYGLGLPLPLFGRWARF